MEITFKEIEGNVLKIKVNSDEESFFSLLKGYLELDSEIDIVGFNKPHHLVDETEFFLKVKKGNPQEIFKKALANVKKDLEKKKVK